VKHAVLPYGALVHDRGSFGAVGALGLDEVLFAREGPFHRPHLSTSIVDDEVGRPASQVVTKRQAVDRQQRLDVVFQTGDGGRKLTGETGVHAMDLAWARAASRLGASRIARTSAMNSGAAFSGIFSHRLARRRSL
jgi:hypothetical protein